MPNKRIYSPEIFTLIPMSELSRRHFEYHPIWSEFYDYDERDEIISWGVDPTWLDAELNRVHDGNDHAAYPVLQPYPLPARMRLYIQATFRTPTGRTFDGYVVNQSVDVIFLLVDDEEIGFSPVEQLKEFNRLELQQLKEFIEAPEEPVFPIHFTTDFLDSDDRLIDGTFQPSLE